ncbi:MAG: glycosyltransferase [Pedobacter sp.]|nr:MAG: glycosyltransferase [Pedobacter sp.]
MKISVVTINYNNSQGLEKTIKSVVDQTYHDIEYLVVDGGSTDGSIDVIQKYQDQVSWFCSEKDNGIYNAMNKGIKQSNGEYLLFLNSGDFLIENTIIEKIEAFGLDKDLIYGDLTFFDTEKKWNWLLPDMLTFEHFYKSTIPHPSTFIKKQLFEKVGLYDEQLKIVSDWKFFIMAAAKFNCTYKHIPLITTEYSFDGLSSNPENLKLIEEERLKVLNEEFSLFLKDYENLFFLKDEMRKIKYFTKTRRFFKHIFKVKKSS